MFRITSSYSFKKTRILKAGAEVAGSAGTINKA